MIENQLPSGSDADGAGDSMSHLSQAEQYLLDQIRAGSGEAWSQFVDRYEGRLIAFARRKLRTAADAEDVVQETFMNFVKALGAFREQSSLETYLFAICRRRIINWTRGKNATICLLQDVLPSEDASGSGNAVDQLAAGDPTASWYVRRDEAHELHARALSAAMRDLIDGLKRSLSFRDLKVVEMLFYCRLRNKDIAQIAGVRENSVAVTKHRYLKQISDRVADELRSGQADRMASGSSAPPLDNADAMLSEIWRAHRLSCLKRSTVGAYLLGTLEPAWHDYVAFHLERLGCQFCQANLEDLQAQTRDDATRQLQDRILQSTVGFLRKP